MRRQDSVGEFSPGVCRQTPGAGVTAGIKESRPGDKGVIEMPADLANRIPRRLYPGDTSMTYDVLRRRRLRSFSRSGHSRPRCYRETKWTPSALAIMEHSRVLAIRVIVRESCSTSMADGEQNATAAHGAPTGHAPDGAE